MVTTHICEREGMTPILHLDKRALEEVFVASSVQEALAYLMAHHDEAQLVAGGTVLMPQVQRRELLATRLVDISRVHSMRTIRQDEDGYLLIGGAATMAALQSWDAVREGAPLLYQAARLIGAPQLRTLATLGGNVVWADGAGEGAVALVAVGAEAEITNFTGAQWLPVATLFVRPGISRVDSMSEIITAFRLRPRGEHEGAAMGRIAPLAGQLRSPFVLAVVLGLDEAGPKIAWAAVAAGALTLVPQRLSELESALVGREATDRQPRETLVKGIVQYAMEKGLIASPDAPLWRQLPELASRLYDRALAAAGNA